MKKVSKIPIIPYKGIRFFGHCLTNRAEIVYGKSGDYYLSIDVVKSRFWALFAIVGGGGGGGGGGG